MFEEDEFIVQETLNPNGPLLTDFILCFKDYLHK